MSIDGLPAREPLLLGQIHDILLVIDAPHERDRMYNILELQHSSNTPTLIHKTFFHAARASHFSSPRTLISLGLQLRHHRPPYRVLSQRQKTASCKPRLLLLSTLPPKHRRASNLRSRSPVPLHQTRFCQHLNVWTTAHRRPSVHEIWAQKPFRSRPRALAGSTSGAEQQRRDLDANKNVH